MISASRATGRLAEIILVLAVARGWRNLALQLAHNNIYGDIYGLLWASPFVVVRQSKRQISLSTATHFPDSNHMKVLLVVVCIEMFQKTSFTNNGML